MISAGAIRQFIHPALLRLWLRHAHEKELVARVGDFRFRVLPSVFHPRFFGSSRIFAEYLVTQDISNKRFLDMGTGSGIVAMFAARAGARVTAVDINPCAVDCAKENGAAAQLDIECLRSDLFSALESRRFDVIAWNPPFFPRRATTLAECALYAGPDYQVIRRFAGEVEAHLERGARLFLVLSKDLDFAAWNSIFNGRLVIRTQRRWGWETMIVVEAIRDEAR